MEILVTIKKQLDILMKQEAYEQVAALFISSIQNAQKEQASELPALYYEYAQFLFDINEYELSLHMFQFAYTLNYNQEEIETFLYNSFVLPNIDEFLDTYNKNIFQYQDKIIVSHLLDYNELPLYFIPVDNEKYFIFNNKTKTFEGIFDLSENNRLPLNNIEFQNSFSDITTSNTWDLRLIKDLVLSNSDRIIYFISTCIDYTLSFLSVPGLMELLCTKLVIFDSINLFQQYFHENTSIYLPRLYYGTTNSPQSKEIAQIITAEHNFRLTPNGRNTSNILLTIGIPSYNRGNQALNNIKHLLLSEYDSEIEFLVSNNCSVENTDGYETIAEMTDNRIHYTVTESNCRTLNFNRVINLAHGKYTCLLSDEDHIILSNLTEYLNILYRNPSISFLKSSNTEFCSCLEDILLKDKNISFYSIFFNLQYISGLIYKTELYHRLNIDYWTKQYINTNIAVDFYPHACFALFFILHGDYYQCSTALYSCGISDDEVTVENRFERLKYTTLESRMQQLSDFTQILNLFVNEIDRITFFNAYIYLCAKTFHCLTIVKDSFLAIGSNWNTVIKTVLEHSILNIDKLNLVLSEEDYNNIKIYIVNDFIKYFEFQPDDL